MPTLQTYLEGRPKAEFAAKVGIRPAYLSQLLSKHRRPSLRLMEKIAAATGGEVDLNSWASVAHDQAHGNNATRSQGPVSKSRTMKARAS